MRSSIIVGLLAVLALGSSSAVEATRPRRTHSVQLNHHRPALHDAEVTTAEVASKSISGNNVGKCGFIAPNGATYDFSSLTGHDYTAAGMGSQYHLQLCGYQSAGTPCAFISPSSSACQIRRDPGAPGDLGEWNASTVQWSFINPDNTAKGVMFTMESSLPASECRLNGVPLPISSEIWLTCASVNSGMSVAQVSGTCTFLFTLATPLACPPPPQPAPVGPPSPSPSTKCGFSGLDFTSLTQFDMVADGAEFNNSLHICGPLTSICQNVAPWPALISTCLTNGNSVYDIGNYPQTSELQWSLTNGRDITGGVHYTLYGGKCDAENYYSSNVNFVCSAQSAPMLVSTDVGSGGCVTNFTLQTPLACAGGNGVVSEPHAAGIQWLL